MGSQTTASQRQPVSLRRIAIAAGVTVAAAAIGNLIILLIAQALLSISFVIPPPPGSTQPFTITPGNVLLDTVIMVAGAAVVYALISRVSAQPVRVFIIVAVIVLLLSFMFPLLLQASLPAKIALCVMHTQTAINVVAIFRRIAPPA